jgi:hypothetical protein
MEEEKELTEAVKEIIYNQLYLTGDLWKSIKCYSELWESTIEITIKSNDYIKYHLERLDLEAQFAELPEYQDVLKRYMEAYYENAIYSDQGSQKIRSKIILELE